MKKVLIAVLFLCFLLPSLTFAGNKLQVDPFSIEIYDIEYRSRADGYSKFRSQVCNTSSVRTPHAKITYILYLNGKVGTHNSGYVDPLNPGECEYHEMPFTSYYGNWDRWGVKVKLYGRNR